MRFNHAQVRRDTISGADHHDISRDQRRSGDRFMIPLSYHYGFAGEHIANALQRFFSIALLDMANQRVNDGNPKDHKHVYPVAHKELKQRGHQQHVNQYVVKMRQEAQPGGFALFLR